MARSVTAYRLGLLPLLLSCVALALLPAGTAAAGSADPAVTEVSFMGVGGVELHGTVVAPASQGAGGPGSTGRHPGLVMLPGAGPGGRTELRSAAEAYARHGVVTLIYDKRTVGYSTVHRDYSVLADDALAALHVLQARPDVDRGEVGLWGLSEGAWPASLAAGRSADVAFLITAGAVGLTPARQQAWAYGEFLGHHQVSGSLPSTLQDTASRQLVGAGLFPEADYDPVPAWEHVHQPVLALWGDLDREAAPAESSRIIRQALDRGGNTHYTIHFVPGVRHNLNLTADGGFDRPSALPADYADYEVSWIQRLSQSGSLPPVSVDPAPQQDRQSQALAPLSWYESPWLQLVAVLVMLAGFAGYPLVGAVRRLRGHRHPAPLGRSARRLAAAGLAASVGTLGYLLFTVLTAANLIGPVFLGRPVPWLVLQCLAVVTVVATVCTVVAWRRTRPVLSRLERARLGLLLTAGAVFVPWAAYWGLLRP
ncbi:prolyl oligopeptidase family serine peptidase [Kitasatospora sp. MAP5-34]|uniref:alpha/beta hydrolase family protein n=1 Tax=Kitasatospora sp. MAP5-34 TaxID=3035102 RepID=UPI002473DA38|nr:prolyl oligopeptidase family serine peptidase [Kitasatospora sp. MAP5-34]MDH6576254.1 dienelactone hydrolase [Kitasatospora sp. MAP5-34]